ncbi:MAG: hypothetical protein O3A00_11105 [Planctomycetota bacterium]|nr:hypothetical protein [Planctomycetota bacterium]
MSGLPERWQRSDVNSPYSQVTLPDGNQVTVIPIVNWPCRGALSIDLTLYHNALDTLEMGPSPGMPPPPDKPPLGYGWTHSYSTRLAEDPMTGDETITEADGRRHLFTKNPDESYTSPAGIFETLVKNADGSFTLTRQDQIKWNFDAAGKLASLVDLNGNSISLSYAGGGNLSSLADPSGRTLSFAYDAGGFLTSVTDPLSRISTFSYQGAPKHLWKAHEPSPSTLFLQFGYDNREQVTDITDKRGNLWSFAHDPPPSHKLTTVTNPQANSRSYVFFTGSAQVTDENGNLTSYVFGTNGELTRFDLYPDPMQPAVTQTFIYDADFNVSANTKPSGAVWEFTWDTNGNLLTVEDPITRLDPNIARATFTYNASNRRTTAKDASGHLHTYAYNAQQNLTQVTDPAGNIATYGYTAFGNRTSQTVNGKTSTLGYDAHGNLTASTDPLGNATRFTSNALGWRTSRTDALNRATNYAHDTMGRVTLVTLPDLSTTAYAHDANGNRTSMTDSTGTTTWAFDTVNRMTSETKGANSLSNVYDAGGQRTSLTDQAGVTVTFEHDGANRLTKVSRGPNWNATYGYDANSNLTTQTNPNGTTVTLGYNTADWLTSIVNKNSSATVLSSFTYAHNTDGLRSSVTESDGSQVSYGYDPLHRLTSEVRTGTNPYNISYGYDPAGNRLNQVRNGVGTTYMYDDANRLLTAGSTTNTWNANGNLLSKTIGGVTTNFAYNFDDQLTSITGSTSVSFGYDGLTRRVSRTAGGVATSFFHDGVRITTEKQGVTMTAHYTYGRELLSRDDGTNYVYYLVDGLGSARQLTDGSQAIVTSYVFEGFGSIVAQTGAAPNAYKFAATSAYRDDGDAGLLHVGLRYYDPAVGRFTTADPVLGHVFRPQSLNRYVYVENNPVNLLDPSGAAWWEWMLGILIVAVSVFIGAVVATSLGGFMAIAAAVAFVLVLGWYAVSSIAGLAVGPP